MRLPFAIVLLACGVARAQPKSERAAEPAEKSEEAPVQEITADEPPVATPPVTPAPAPEPEEVRPVHTMEEVTVPRSNLRFGINFFGDTSFVVTRPAEPATSFSIGTFGVRMLGELGPSIDALGELAFEATSAGPIADVEQLAVRWKKGPGALIVGRFHTDLGYWNTAYHHGLWLQTPVERPHALRFEDDGGLVPVHWVGAQYTLEKTTATSRIGLVLAVGNGRGAIVDDVRVKTDTNAAKSVLAKLRIKASSVEAGIGAVYDLIAGEPMLVRPALPDQKIYELIGSAYIMMRAPHMTAIVEGYTFRHEGAARSWMTYSGYALVGFPINEWLTPYVAADVVTGADDDPFFTPNVVTAVPYDLVEVVGGTRFDISTWSALKIELEVERLASTDENAYMGTINWSFGL